MEFSPPEWHQTLTSTNQVLLQRLAAGEDLPEGFVLAAYEQTAGRGRYQRRWLSQAKRDLTFTFLLCPEAQGDRLASLSLAVALGVRAALAAFGVGSRTKWPNDLLVDDSKICGILAERAGRNLVIGIGLNVNMDEATAARIDRPVTSIYLQTGVAYAVETVLDALLNALPAWLDRWEESGFAALQQEWTVACQGLGQPVAVGEGNHRRQGVLYGFGHAGQLLLKNKKDQIEEIWAGDVDLLL